VPISNLVFLDESGANLQMAPLYGRGYKQARVRYPVPVNRGSRLTLIGAISFQKVEAALYGEWSTNGEIFLNFIEKCLCPVLHKGQVVVMDNVAFHRVSGVKEAIEKMGARLVYLPPYSPELNPIEAMWGKVKTSLRKASARTLDKFKVAIKIAFESVQSTDLNNWFQHSGYSAQ
jgi:transposase